MAELKIALAGNPNCGKTTLFNALTGANQYVGNWPGVTVEKKEGRLRDHKDVIIQDLPGIYSLSPYTLEEVVSRTYLVEEKPDVILNIVDGTNIERNLYLTTQLLEIGIPTVIAVNMIDLVKKNGDVIDFAALSGALGCPVVEMSALKSDGSMEAAEMCIKLAQKQKERNTDTPHVYSGPVEHAIAHIEESLENLVDKRNLRWYAVKVFERDEKVIESLHLDNGVKNHIEEQIRDCEKELDDDSESIITNARYEYIQELVKRSIRKSKSEKLSASDKIDRVLTNRWAALPIFAGVMFLVYFIAVTTVGTWVTDWTNDTLFGGIIQPAVQTAMENAGADWAVDLVVNGIIGGLGAPIGFLPQMAIVFFLLSFLEDVGYMARVAFIMDRIFRRFGLSGKSFIPFLISSGCGVPGIMATRTIESEKDRRMTMMTTTFIPCGAKLPVIAAIAGFIMGGAWWAAPLCYFAGITIVICSCIILKKTKSFAGDPVPFVMELPQYHMPSIKTLLMHVWERVWAFFKKAGTILFLCCLVMWFLGSCGIVGGSLAMVDEEDSFLAVIGGAIAVVFAPLGFGTWQAAASTISGFAAKEGIVSTMGVLSGLGEIEEYDAGMHAAFASFFPTTIAAISFLCFNLFDSPCLAAISTVAREMGSRKYFWFTILFQNINSYLVALMVYQIGGLFAGQVAFNPGTIAAFIVLGVILYLLFRPDPNKKRENAWKAETARS